MGHVSTVLKIQIDREEKHNISHVYNLFAHFCLVRLRLALSRNQSKDERLVTAHGEHHEIHFNTGYSRHLADFKARHLLRAPTEEEKEEFRSLLAGTPVARLECAVFSLTVSFFLFSFANK